MVGDHVHVDRTLRILLGLLFEQGHDIGGVGLGSLLIVVGGVGVDTLCGCDVVEEVLHRPCIVGIE